MMNLQKKPHPKCNNIQVFKKPSIKMSRFYKTCDKKQLAEKTSNSSERCTRFCASAVGWGAPTCGSRVYLLLFSLLALVPCNGPKLNDRGETAIHSHPHSHSHLGSVQSEHMAKFHIHDVTWKHTVAKCHLQVDFWTMGLPLKRSAGPVLENPAVVFSLINYGENQSYL